MVWFFIDCARSISFYKLCISSHFLSTITINVHKVRSVNSWLSGSSYILNLIIKIRKLILTVIFNLITNWFLLFLNPVIFHSSLSSNSIYHNVENACLFYFLGRILVSIRIFVEHSSLSLACWKSRGNWLCYFFGAHSSVGQRL